MHTRSAFPRRGRQTSFTEIPDNLPSPMNRNDWIFLPQYDPARGNGNNYQMRVDFAGINWGVQNNPAAASYATAISPDKQIMRFEIHSGDCAPSDIGRGVDRTELNPGIGFDKTQVNVWEYSLFIEPGAPYTFPGFCILGQLHATEDDLDLHTSPVWAYYFNAGEYFRPTSRTSLQDPLVDAPPSRYHAWVPETRNQWNRYKLRYYCDPYGNGVIQQWRNGVPIFDFRGAVGFIDIQGARPQFGIYRATQPDPMVVYYTNMRYYYEAP